MTTALSSRSPSASLPSEHQQEAERRMMEEALGHREVRNEAAPPVWTGASGEVATRRVGARVGYTPEGF